MTPTARCFVGVRPGPEAVTLLRRSIERLRATGAPVRWVDPDRLHLTVKFLGDVERERIGAVADALRVAVAAHAPFALRVAGLGRFPSHGAARVVWAGLEGDVARLQALVADIETRLEPLGFAAERRPFRPHITLGRARGPRGQGPLLDALEQTRVEGGAFKVDALTLFESALTPSGARYQEIGRFPLG